MKDQNKIDSLDEALRILYLDMIEDYPSPQLSRDLSRLISIEKGPIASEKEEQLIKQLYSIMTEISFGQLFQQKIVEKGVNEAELAGATGLAADVINDLKNDTIYPNNIPIRLFKELIFVLQLPFASVKSAVLKTFNILKGEDSFDQSMPGGLVPTYRKGYSADVSELKRKDSVMGGKAHFENEEALNKYLTRLEELMTE
jgi:hypothetical protein